MYPARLTCPTQVLVADPWLSRVVGALVLGNGLMIGILLLHIMR